MLAFRQHDPRHQEAQVKERSYKADDKEQVEGKCHNIEDFKFDDFTVKQGKEDRHYQKVDCLSSLENSFESHDHSGIGISGQFQADDQILFKYHKEKSNKCSFTENEGVLEQELNLISRQLFPVVRNPVQDLNDDDSTNCESGDNVEHDIEEDPIDSEVPERERLADDDGEQTETEDGQDGSHKENEKDADSVESGFGGAHGGIIINLCYIVTLLSIIKGMDATMEEKQQYLRANILEAGYDAEDFIEFLHENTSEQTPDMNQISLEEIQSIVQMYKKKKVPKLHSQIMEEPDSPNRKSTHIENSRDISIDKKMIFSPDRMKLYEERKSKIQYKRYHPLFDYEFKGAVKCIESEKLVEGETLTVEISDMETKEIEGFLFGLGAKTEYYYHIKTNLIKGTIKRLSEDFDWLNATLQRLYPHLLLPELEGLRKDIKDPYLKRKKEIEEYMQHLACKKFLHSSQVFVDFITLSLEKMEKYKKSFDSMGFAKGVSLLKNVEGIIDIELSNNIIDFYNNSKNFTKVTSHAHEQLTVAIAKMSESIRVATVDTYAVVDLFAELYDSYGELTNKFPVLKKEHYSDTLVNLNNLFLGIGDNLKSSADLVDSHIKQYYRFSSGYDKNLHKLQKVVKEAQIQYLDFKYNLSRKKERVISDPSKWEINAEKSVKNLSKEELMEIILPKDALAESQFKSWYAFCLKNYQSEFQEYLDFCTRRYNRVFKKFSIELLNENKKYLEVITKLLGETRKKQNA